MNRTLHAVGGYLRMHIRTSTIDTVNELNNSGKIFWELTPEEGGYSFCCSLFEADEIKAFLQEREVEYSVERFRGLPRLLRYFKNRLGLLLGLLFAMIIVYMASTVVWEVRINCNGEFDEAAVRQSLSELGVNVGANIKDINVYKSELQFLVNNKEFSDIAVNLEGTVASVELRLKRVAERHPPLTGYYDIVAEEAGVIKSITARHGVPTVKAGDSVEAGQVLISGLMVGKFGENYLYHAEGTVSALVQREFYVSIPLETTRKEYTGKTERRLCYEILGKEFNLFCREESGFEKAEIEPKTTKVTFFGMKTPVQKHELLYREYVIVPEFITKAEGERRAAQALEAYLEREQVKASDIQTQFTYNSVTDSIELLAIIQAESDIGREQLNILETTEQATD